MFFFLLPGVSKLVIVLNPHQKTSSSLFVHFRVFIRIFHYGLNNFLKFIHAKMLYFSFCQKSCQKLHFYIVQILFLTLRKVSSTQLEAYNSLDYTLKEFQSYSYFCNLKLTSRYLKKKYPRHFIVGNYQRKKYFTLQS